MDYCFLGNKDEASQPVLIVKYRDTRMMLSFLVQWNGNVADYPVKRIMAFIKELRYQACRIIIKTDQETRTTAVQDKLAKERGEAPTIIENSPVRSSGSNGVVERAIPSVEGQVRVLRDALEARLSVKIEAKHPVMTCPVEYAAFILNRYEVG